MKKTLGRGLPTRKKSRREVRRLLENEYSIEETLERVLEEVYSVYRYVSNEEVSEITKEKILSYFNETRRIIGLTISELKRKEVFIEERALVEVKIEDEKFEVRTPFIVGREAKELRLCLRSLGSYSIREVLESIKFRGERLPVIYVFKAQAPLTVSKAQFLVYSSGRSLYIVSLGRRKMSLVCELGEYESEGGYKVQVFEAGSWCEVWIETMPQKILIKLSGIETI